MTICNGSITNMLVIKTVGFLLNVLLHDVLLLEMSLLESFSFSGFGLAEKLNEHLYMQ